MPWRWRLGAGAALGALGGSRGVVGGSRGAVGGSRGGRWSPPAHLTWYWQLQGAPKLEPVQVTDTDGFENPTGFHIAAAQQFRYDVWVAREVHSLHMAVFEKNDPEQARRLEPHFDGVLDEQCNQYQECGSFEPYLKAGKPVLNAEYRAPLYPRFCTADRRLGIEGALFGLALDGRLFKPCPGA